MSEPAETALHVQNAVICLDCEALFPIGPEACPKCASASFLPLERWLTAAAPRAWSHAPVDGTRLVSFADVLHHAGNGLTPAMANAEQLVEALTVLAAGKVPGVARLAVARAQRIVTAIHQTMERLHQLPPRSETGVSS